VSPDHVELVKRLLEGGKSSGRKEEVSQGEVGERGRDERVRPIVFGDRAETGRREPGCKSNSRRGRERPS